MSPVLNLIRHCWVSSMTKRYSFKGNRQEGETSDSLLASMKTVLVKTSGWWSPASWQLNPAGLYFLSLKYISGFCLGLMWVRAKIYLPSLYDVKHHYGGLVQMSPQSTLSCRFSPVSLLSWAVGLLSFQTSLSNCRFCIHWFRTQIPHWRRHGNIWLLIGIYRQIQHLE